MEFLNPHDSTQEDLRQQMLEVAERTTFTYPYLLQEVRRCFMENNVLVIVDETHHIDWSYSRFHSDGPEEIEAFIDKWANMTTVNKKKAAES